VSNSKENFPSYRYEFNVRLAIAKLFVLWALTLHKFLASLRRQSKHMNRPYISFIVIGLIGLSGVLYSTTVISQQPTPPAPDAVQEAQTPRQVQSTRPEQQQTPHDQSDIFAGPSAPPSSPVLETQPDQGKMLGFDFARDPLDAKQPMQTPEEIMKNDIADKPKVISCFGLQLNEQEKRDLVAFMRQS
jgi:hypothetical protein